MEKRIIRKQVFDASTAIAAFLLGIAAILSIYAVYILITDLTWFLILLVLVVITYLILVFSVVLPRQVIIESRRNINQIKQKVGSNSVAKIEEDELVCEPKEKEYVASSTSNTYHLNTCRFSKMIKDKYKEQSDDSKKFRKKGYEPCSVCIKRK